MVPQGKRKSKKNKKKRNKGKKMNNGEIPEETIKKFHETFDSLVEGDSDFEGDFRGPRQSRGAIQ